MLNNGNMKTDKTLSLLSKHSLSEERQGKNKILVTGSI
jgi:hypothetical protein